MNLLDRWAEPRRPWLGVACEPGFDLNLDFVNETVFNWPVYVLE